jgi:hypothetical protein
MRPRVQSLWIGERLSTIQQLSIRSFLARGHDFVLYAYEAIDGVPAGTCCRDAREILPRERVFLYADGFGRGSPAGFSNYFRYKLLLEKGGWWVDLDTVCLKSFDALAGEHVLGYQRTPSGALKVASSIIKAPAGSELMRRCWDHVGALDPQAVRWGQTGPDLLDAKVRELGMERCVLAPHVFFEINHWQADEFLRSTVLPADSYATHLWGARWKDEERSPDARYPEDSLFERLKAQYLMEA